MEVRMTRRMSREKAIGGGRKPLLDRTNALGKPSSWPPPPPLPRPPSDFVSSGFTSRKGSGDVGARGSGSGSAALALAFSRPRSGSSSVVGCRDVEVGEPCNVYHRKPTKAKRKCGVKALWLPLSRSSVERMESIGKEFDKIGDDDGISKSGITPSKRKQHLRLNQRDKPNNSLQDFIKQQQSYFAGIDAFELLEEEVAAAEASE